MDEEEELENTLIGQEEAPAVNTEGALMGNIPSNNVVSFVNTTGQQSNVTTQLADTASANIGVPMTGMRPIDPATGQPRSEEFLQRAEDAGVTNLLAQASVPLPQTPSALPEVVADQPQAAVNPFLQAPIAPMGPEETRARLGGMTLNEYLNAPAGTPGVSGLRTDPQGRMISTPAPAFVNNFALQASGGQTGPAKVSDEIMSQIDRPAPQTAEFRDSNRDGIEDREQGIFRPGELLGYDAQGNEVRAPGTQQPVNRTPAPAQPSASALSDFERASLAREARLAARDRLPGETQTERDTRIAQSRTEGSRPRGGLSQSDLRDLAQGSAKGATEGKRARALEIQQRAGLGAFKPDMTPLQEQALRTRIEAQETAIGQGQAASADTDSFNTSISNSTSAGGVIDYNKALDEYVRGGGSNRGYLEFLRKGQELAQEAIDAGRKPEIKVIELDGFKVLTQDDKYMTATTIGGEELSTSAIRTLRGRIELIEDAEKDYFSGDPERKRRAERTITALNIKGDFGTQLTAEDYFEPDAGPEPFNPNTLSAEEKRFYDRLVGNDKQAFEYTRQFPNSAQTQVILKYLEQTYPDVD